MLEHFIQSQRDRELAVARSVLERTALEQNLPVEKVLFDISEAILAGWNNPDPLIHEHWLQVPRKGEIPTPEEFLLWLMKQMRDNPAGDSTLRS